jgi:hypothetical protein
MFAWVPFSYWLSQKCGMASHLHTSSQKSVILHNIDIVFLVIFSSFIVNLNGRFYGKCLVSITVFSLYLILYIQTSYFPFTEPP